MPQMSLRQVAAAPSSCHGGKRKETPYRSRRGDGTRNYATNNKLLQICRILLWCYTSTHRTIYP